MWSLNRLLQCKTVKIYWSKTPYTIALHTKTITPMKNVERAECLKTIQKEVTQTLEHSINQSQKTAHAFIALNLYRITLIDKIG